MKTFVDPAALLAQDNPIAADSGESNPPIVLGDRVEIDIDGGDRTVKMPAVYGLIHDQSGRNWPRNSLLIAPFAKGGGVIESPSDRLTDWFGQAYDPKAGDVKFPPKDGWEDEGLVHAVWYTRTGGEPYGRQPFVHHVKGRTFPFFGKTIKVHLRKRGDLYRVDFPQGLVVTWRGISEV